MNHAGQDQTDRSPSAWMFLPVEQALFLGLACLVAPGLWAAYLMSQGRLLSGGVLFLAWLAVMGALGIWAHRRRYVRLWVTGLLVVVVLFGCALVYAGPHGQP